MSGASFVSANDLIWVLRGFERKAIIVTSESTLSGQYLCRRARRRDRRVFLRVFCVSLVRVAGGPAYGRAYRQRSCSAADYSLSGREVVYYR